MNKAVPVALALAICAPALSAEETAHAPFSKEFVSEVVRHLYRWHFDETALHTVSGFKDVEFWIRPVQMDLDEGDRSAFYEMVGPRLRFRVVLKKADYEVKELGLRVRNAGFRVLRVERLDELPDAEDGYEVLRIDRAEILDYLFRTRDQRSYPDAGLLDRLRLALREEMSADSGNGAQGPQTVYIGPLSPVSNDLWVFWESAGMLIRFSSDSDLATPAYWSIEKLGVDVYDLDTDVVVSMDEAAGSNAFVTRDWAARALFNCVVFGQRMTVTPASGAGQPATFETSPRAKPGVSR